MYRRFLKDFYESSELGYWVVSSMLKIRSYLKYERISDKEYLKKRFFNSFNRDIDFQNPSTLNEKILWLKLYDRRPLHTKCADKFEVRKYIKDLIGKEFLVPLYYQTYNYKDISPDKIPDKPVIIKTNHDSGGGIFVYDKKTVNFDKIRQSLRRRMAINYYQRSKEWQYKNIKPHIMVEKLLLDKKGNIPTRKEAIQLNELCIGEEGIIVGVKNTNNEFLQYLEEMNLTLGKKIKVEKVFDFDKSKIIHTEKKSVTISKEVSSNLIIEKL